MRRSRPSEEWERKKDYLVRSLFEDIPVLSPILEGHEPVSLSSPRNFVNSTESPLPELIIEVEPKKPNLHDDPEELYDALAKEIRRRYKKDFLGNGSDMSDTCDKDDSYETIHFASESLKLQDVHSETYEMDNNLAREQQGLRENKQYGLSGEDSINISKTTNVIEPIQGDDDDFDTAKRSDSESFAKDTNASSTDSTFDSSVNSSQASPEIMRQRRRSVSFKTPPHYPLSESNSTVCKTINLSMEVDSKELPEEVLASNQETEIAEDSVDETSLLVTSTPTRKRKSSRLSTTKGHKRRLVSYSSSSFASVANAATQTSFSDCETDWNFFWSNFFVGVPTVYNVCSCNNHVCNT